MVQGDVNGDGYNNDRAFIYNPAAAPDTIIANGINNLLNNAPSSVRQCLNRQLDHIAGRNSCEGPWSTSLSLRMSLVSQAVKSPDRATVSIRLNNPLTAIDALVHRSNNTHCWVAPAFTTPSHLSVLSHL